MMILFLTLFALELEDITTSYTSNNSPCLDLICFHARSITAQRYLNIQLIAISMMSFLGYTMTNSHSRTGAIEDSKDSKYLPPVSRNIGAQDKSTFPRHITGRLLHTRSSLSKRFSLFDTILYNPNTNKSNVTEPMDEDLRADSRKNAARER